MNDPTWLGLYFLGIASVLLLVAGAAGSLIAWLALVFRAKKKGKDLLLVPVLKVHGFEEKGLWLVSARNRCYLCLAVGLVTLTLVACVAAALGYSFGPN